MNKIDQLIIRACKSKDPDTRLKSVYRRFYLSNDDLFFASITGILARLCEDNLNFTVGALITELNPHNGWKYGVNPCNHDYDYWEHCSKVLTSKIRLSMVSEFDGLAIPLRFKGINT